jgi:hypothetical protein
MALKDCPKCGMVMTEVCSRCGYTKITEVDEEIRRKALLNGYCYDCGKRDPNNQYMERSDGRRRCRRCYGKLGSLMNY